MLDDDLSSWNVGDKLVIASTDYHFKQAEEVDILKIDGNKVTVKGLKNLHIKISIPLEYLT